MNTAAKIVFPLICCVCPSGVHAAFPVDSMPATRRALTEFTGFYSCATLPFSNPGVMTRRRPYSMASAGIGFESVAESKATTVQLGSGRRDLRFAADAYMRLNSSAVWGNASYVNGCIKNVRLCESPDYQRVEPYTIADTIGGDMKSERYCFGAGYAASAAILDWGVRASYDAGLYYRQTDPRPKSITGLLRISAGTAFHAADYLIGPALEFCRYRQTTDVTFVSETGDAPLYHTTGLGTHYSRFAGAAQSVFSDTYTFTLSATLFPAAKSGFFLATNLSTATMNYVVRDLNKLPMARLTTRMVVAEAGYFSDGQSVKWKAYACFSGRRRHGKENLFGDAASGSYPVIGSRQAYADNGYQATAGGCITASTDRWIWSACPEAGYSHQLVATAMPHRVQRIDRIKASLRLSASVNAGRRWAMAIAVKGAFGSSPNSYLKGIPSTDRTTDRADALMAEATAVNFRNATTARRQIEASLMLQYSLSSRYALALAARFSHTGFSTGIHTNQTETSIQFIF